MKILITKDNKAYLWNNVKRGVGVYNLFEGQIFDWKFVINHEKAGYSIFYDGESEIRVDNDCWSKAT